MDLVTEGNKVPALGILSVLPENQLHQVCISQGRLFARQIANQADIGKHDALEKQLRAAILGEVSNDATILSHPASQPESVSGPPSTPNSPRSESVGRTNLHPASESDAEKNAMIGDL